MTDARQSDGTEIAVIGMMARVPGADGVEQFWRNLKAGVVSISGLSDDDLRKAGVRSRELAAPTYVKAGGVIADRERFDAALFGVTPKQATLMDPQQRHFLECCWAALEDAGYTPLNLSKEVGVYAGASANSYLMFHLWPRLLRDPEAGFESCLTTLIAGAPERLSTQVSYKLNLHGPSLSISAACSTSLVAVHLACQGLIAQECEMALAGGTCMGGGYGGHNFLQDGPFSPDGICRPYDRAARGTVGGSGVGVVVLKRLADALRDGDTVRAVVLGSAVNNDGNDKVGYTAPSVRGQENVIRQALSVAGVSARSIGYLEGHGTATPLGDPIEVRAITKAYGAHSSDRGFCAIGSVKANLGHLDSAAGIASFIKAALIVERGEIPPTPNFTEENPDIDFAGAPVFVNRSLRPWSGTGPRRAAVSAFGIGGTNAHVIIEQPPPREHAPTQQGWQVLCLSARTATALDRMTANLRSYLERNPNQDLADVAFTLQVGRAELPHRRTFCHQSGKEPILLGSPDCDAVVTEKRARIGAFVFRSRVTLPAGIQAGERAALKRELALCSDELIRHDVDLARVLRDGAGSPRALRAAAFSVQAAIVRELTASGGACAATFAEGELGEAVRAYIEERMSLRDALRLALRAESEDAMTIVLPERDDTVYLSIAPNESGGAMRSLLCPVALRDLSEVVATLLGRMWAHGVPIDWRAYHGGTSRMRIPLPSYPFEGDRYWEPAFTTLEADATSEAERSASVPPPGWLLRRTWRRAPARRSKLEGGAAREAWLILSEEHGISAELVATLRRRGASVEVIERADLFAGAVPLSRIGARLADCLADRVFDRVACAWTLEATHGSAQEFEVLWLLARMLAMQTRTAPTELIVLTTELFDVTGAESAPDATWIGGLDELLGETGLLRSRVFDLDRAASESARDGVLAEVLRGGGERTLAWRGAYGWVPVLEPEARGQLVTGALEFALVGCEHPEDHAILLAIARGLPRASKLRLVSRRMPGIAGRPDEVASAPLRTLNVQRLYETLAADCHTLHQRTGHGAHVSFLAATEKLCARWALEYFAGVGISTEPGSRVARSLLYRDVVPQFRKFVGFLVSILEREGIVRKLGDELEFTDVELPSIERMKDKFLREHPAGATWFEFVERCVAAYPDVFRGRRSAPEVLYPEGSYEPLRRMERETPDFTNRQECHELLVRAFKRILGESEDVLDVLEVGGGNGLVTWDLAEAARERGVRYVFSDLGRSFVAEAERHSARRGINFMRFMQYDVSADPASQGLELGSFDVIVAFNVVQATPHVTETLAKLRTLLSSGGVLLMLNTVLDLRWYGLVFGLAPGWWDYEDEPLRMHSPLLSADRWQELLRKTGYTQVHAFPANEHDHRALIVARREERQSDVMAQERTGHASCEAALLARLREENEVELVPMSPEEVEGRAEQLDGLILLEEVARADRLREANYGCALRLRERRLAVREQWQRAAHRLGARYRLRISRGRAGDATERLARAEGTVARPGEGWTTLEYAGDDPAQLTAAMGSVLASEPALGALMLKGAPADAWRSGAADGPSSSLEMERNGHGAGTQEPAGLERAIAAIWQEVLGIPAVDPHEYFFEVGGDSLAGLQVLARIQRRYRIELGIRDLLSAATVAGMTAKVEQSIREQHGEAAALKPASLEPIPVLESGSDDIETLYAQLQSLPD